MTPLSRRRCITIWPMLGAAVVGACRRKDGATARQGGEGHASVEPVTVYRALNGSPGDNLEKVLELAGGTALLFGADDIVILKPNLQWYNQGASNIAAMERLVALIMARPGGFRGEVVLAENVHRGPAPWERAGWATPFARNGGLPGIRNFNDLANKLKETFGDSFSVCHLVDAAAGGKRVRGPADGPGYVICDGTGGVPLLALHNGLRGARRRETAMSYPVFRTDKGTLVDYRLGVWEKGDYTGQPIKLVNCSALNHHSVYCGVTGAVKNFLGISDLSGGPNPAAGGRLSGDYYNFHAFPFDGDAKGPVPGMLGAEVGYFIKTVRRPALNITTAEYCGLVSRLGAPVARTRAVAASTDPVALDFHTAKYILFPNSGIQLHNPDNPRSSLAQDLRECARVGGYCYGETGVKVISFDLASGKLQERRELAVRGDREWGGNLRNLLKFGTLRIL
jgi:hypothetical protein